MEIPFENDYVTIKHFNYCDLCLDQDTVIEQSQ